MLRRYSINFVLFSIFLDALLTLFGFYIIHIPFINIFFQHSTPDFQTHMPFQGLPVIAALIWISVFITIGIYDGHRNMRFFSELSWLITGTGIAATTIAGVFYYFNLAFSRTEFTFSVFVTFFLTLIWRTAIRAYWRLNPRQSEFHRRFLVVGAGSVGQFIAAQIIENSHHNFTLVGFLDDDKTKRKQPQILGTIDQILASVNQFQVDDVLLALPAHAYQRTEWAVSQLQSLPVQVWLIPDHFRLSLFRTTVDEIAGIPMLNMRAPALSEYQRFFKRILDLVLASLILLLIWPFMLLVALLVRLSSPGPVIYHSERVGENGRLFNMLKYRTMVMNADQQIETIKQPDENGNLIHKHPQDPRVTRLGRFLRKFSIDEWPQFINVLKGEMSLVGPRPELPSLVEKYEPWQRVRFTVPQGITGWWQVNGRSDRPLHLNTADDIFYVKNYSIRLDLQILLRTILVVLFGRGAY